MSENELPTVCFADSPLWDGASGQTGDFSVSAEVCRNAKGSLNEGAGKPEGFD